VTSEKPLPFALPDIGQAEIDAVTDVMRSRWLTTGQQCRQFEEAFATAVGATHAVALNSCTAALHLSLEALGVCDGDLVFMSPYTFAATAEVVSYLRATPVFVDVDPVTLNIDPAQLRAAVASRMDGRSGRPRVIMPVHIAGVPCAMDELWALAREYDLAVVEDAAHAFPASYQGRPIGRVPDGIAGSVCFSFYATKTITTGEGGMLVTEDPALADRARSMSLHGLSRQAWARYADGGSWAYDIIAPGFKYNLTDVAAAMGLVQLARAEAMQARRAEIAEAYNAAFAELAGLECPSVPTGTETAWHLYLLRLDDDLRLGRDGFVRRLTALGIGTSVHFIPLHLHSYYVQQYGYRAEDYPVAAAEFRRVISLPIYSAMSDADARRVIAAVKAIAKNPSGVS
jgi:dTDP-4-amino-4,6-dideoxygalactose transaminase